MNYFLDQGSYPLIFGGASISGEGAGYGFGDISEAESLELLEAAWDKGVRIFDTAPIYGFGLSEERIGTFAKNKGDQAFIVSKSGVSWHSSRRVNMTNDPKETLSMLEGSLRRLKRDKIDLYMIHWPDDKVDIRRPMEVLAKAKRKEMIGHIGLCNTSLEDLGKAGEIESIEAVQCQLNVFERDIEKEVLPYCTQRGIPFMSWGTLDKGILTGRVSKERRFDKSDCRSWAPWWKKMNKEKRYQAVSLLEKRLSEDGFNLLSFALSFNLSRSSEIKLICGGRSGEQWSQLHSSLDQLVPSELMEECLMIVDEVLST